jgi:hypothetical protein
MRALVLAAAAWARPPAAAAQLPHLMPADSPWLDVNYPKVFWTPREGFTAGAYLAFVRALTFEDAYRPPPYAAAVSLDGQLSTSGSRYLTLDARFPYLLPGWRLALSLSGARRARDNYFGIGNASIFDGDLVTATQRRYYQARDTRWTARGELQRHLVGGLRLLGGFSAERWTIAPPDGPSVLAADAAGGVDPSIGVATSDITLRGGLVFDTRDDEAAANRGVLLEAIHATTVGGDLDYTRTTASAAGYLPVGESVVIAARAMAQGMGGTPRLGSLYLVEASDRPYRGLGGGLSHRALAVNRFIGRHKLLFNLDVRYHVVNLPRTARATLLGFVDAGRVFEGEPLTFTTTGLKWGGGLGLYLQIARSGILGTTLGRGPDGFVMDVATRWTY